MNSHKSESKTVIFYAPVGNLIKGFKNGGAEAGCRKTMEVLQKGGHEIILVEKPAKESDSKADGFGLLLNLLKVWIKAIGIMRKHPDAVVHVAGFYLNQIYFEWVLTRTANFLGVKTIYEIRNGGMIEAYREGNAIYRYFMKSTLLHADTILCQGYDYVIFLRESWGKDSVYYPNYIMDDFVTGNETDRASMEAINLIYFGRVVPDKNVEFIIDVCNELRSHDVRFKLNIIGAYEEDYHTLLKSKIHLFKLEESVTFHGRKDFGDIYKHLKKSHFFVFPSKEKREGHSNSLTEAMGCGVVPIASAAGFNNSIVGHDELIISDFDSGKYASKIAGVWSAKKWADLSDKVYQRIVNNYTESIVKRSLLDAYQRI